MKPFAFLLMLFPALALPVKCSNEQVNTKEPVSVTVRTISFTQESRSQVFPGTIEAKKTSIIGASYPGRLAILNVRKGQSVKMGSTLAVIDSPAAKSLYESAKATYEQAKDALDRVNQVYSTGSVTELKLVEVQTSFSKAEAAYAAASRALEDCRIKAPYSGVVGDIFLQEGVEVTAAEPIFRFLDVNVLEAHASVPENEYASYHIGQSAKVQVDAVGLTKDAELTDKGFEASPLSHSYDFVFKIKGSTGKMMPGMVCKVHISNSSSTSSEYVVIPSSSVRVDSEGRYVWCIDSEGAVEKKHITVNGFSGDGVIVEEGLSEGDRLVVEGGNKISTGMRNITINECQ